MHIPRYRLYWRASGLWAIPRIPYGARLIGGLAVLWVGAPLCYGLIEAPWGAVATVGCVVAGIALGCWKD